LADDFCRDWPGSTRRPSYKGIFFEVAIDSEDGGRTVQIHRYPNRDDWDNEDIAKQPRMVQVAAYVVGDDADLQNQKLLAACDSPGAGWLVLPLRPARLARCIRASSIASEETLGRFDFQMEFVYESPGIGGIFSSILLSGAVKAAVEVGVSAVESLFSRNFDSVMRRFSPVTIVPAVARDAAAVTIGLVADALDDIRRRLMVADDEAASDAEFAVRSMRENATSLAYTGARASKVEASVYVADQENIDSGFAGDLARTLKRFEDAAADVRQLAELMAELQSFEAQPILSSIDCLTVRAERALTKEVALYVRRLALLRRTSAVSRIVWASRKDAVSGRCDISVAYREIMEELNDSTTETAMIEARNTVVNLISRTAAELPPTIIIQSPGYLPAASLAATVYNDASRDAELFWNSGAEHPLFMPLVIEARQK